MLSPIFWRAIRSTRWLGVSVAPVRVPRPAHRAKSFGLVLSRSEPYSPAANGISLAAAIFCSPVPTKKSFSSLEGPVGLLLQGKGPRLLRLAFLRGNYERYPPRHRAAWRQRVSPGCRRRVISRLPHRSFAARSRRAAKSPEAADRENCRHPPQPSIPSASSFPTRRPMCCWLTPPVNHPHRLSNRS